MVGSDAALASAVHHGMNRDNRCPFFAWSLHSPPCLEGVMHPIKGCQLAVAVPLCAKFRLQIGTVSFRKADAQSRWALTNLDAGQAADCCAAETCSATVTAPPGGGPIARTTRMRSAADRGSRGQPEVRSKATHRWKSCFSLVLYRGRNAV